MAESGAMRTSMKDGETVEVTIFTFGVKYNTEDHPTLGKIDPSRWLEVRGCDPETARALMVGLCGTAWAFQYSARDFDYTKSFNYEAGPFMVIDVRDLR